MLRITISPSTYFFTFMQKNNTLTASKHWTMSQTMRNLILSSSSLHQNNVQCIAGKYPVEIREDITGYWSCRNIQKVIFKTLILKPLRQFCSLEVTGQILFTRSANYWSALPIWTQRILSCYVRIFRPANHPLKNFHHYGS